MQVAEEGKSKVSTFQDHLPLIAAICNPGLRERHWQVCMGSRELDSIITVLYSLIYKNMALHAYDGISLTSDGNCEGE